MMALSHCDCLVCRLEKELCFELSCESATKEYQGLAATIPALSAFPTAVDLVRDIHTPNPAHYNPTSDALILALLQQNIASDQPSLWQRILLQIFIPTIHRTSSKVTIRFPLLPRDDVSQHVLCSLVEFLPSQELRSRRSHLAFAVARKLRRSAFRWAIHEARATSREEANGSAAIPVDLLSRQESFSPAILLDEFLDQCQRARSLSQDERNLLLEFKIEGWSCLELAGRNGHSAVAIQHRVQRLVDRLRRMARQRRSDPPRQLPLFPE
jgi:DNA-directed RNA polymerase specialized sigma24 family protein